MPTALDQRRLADGERALAAEEPPENAHIATLRAYKAVLHDGIAALQSLDDLGPEMNQNAADVERVLMARFDRTAKRLNGLATQ